MTGHLLESYTNWRKLHEQKSGAQYIRFYQPSSEEFDTATVDTAQSILSNFSNCKVTNISNRILRVSDYYKTTLVIGLSLVEEEGLELFNTFGVSEDIEVTVSVDNRFIQIVELFGSFFSDGVLRRDLKTRLFVLKTTDYDKTDSEIIDNFLASEKVSDYLNKQTGDTSVLSEADVSAALLETDPSKKKRNLDLLSKKLANAIFLEIHKQKFSQLTTPERIYSDLERFTKNTNSKFLELQERIKDVYSLSTEEKDQLVKDFQDFNKKLASFMSGKYAEHKIAHHFLRKSLNLLKEANLKPY